MTEHQSVPIYRTEIIAIVQCMYAHYVIWGGGSGELVDDILAVDGDPNGMGQLEGAGN